MTTNKYDPGMEESVRHLQEMWKDSPDVSSTFDVVQVIEERAQREIQAAEDRTIFSLLDQAAEDIGDVRPVGPPIRKDPVLRHEDGFMPLQKAPSNIPPEFETIANAPLKPTKLFMHPQLWEDLTGVSVDDLPQDPIGKKWLEDLGVTEVVKVGEEEISESKS